MRVQLLLLALVASTAFATSAGALGSVHKCVLTSEATVCVDLTGASPDPTSLTTGDIDPRASCTADLPPSHCVVEVDANGEPVVEALLSIRS